MSHLNFAKNLNNLFRYLLFELCSILIFDQKYYVHSKGCNDDNNDPLQFGLLLLLGYLVKFNRKNEITKSEFD